MKKRFLIWLAALLGGVSLHAQPQVIDCLCLRTQAVLNVTNCMAAVPDLCLFTQCLISTVQPPPPVNCSQTPTAGTLVGPGITMITVTVINSMGLAEQCNIPFTVTAPANGPFALICATNKSVECGTTWTFNQPTPTNYCCPQPGTPGIGVTVVSVTTTTNGTCPQVITRTWTAKDACQHTASCSQTVTVVDTIPPVITCASNRIVECGAAWNFNPPSASDICDGTNLTIIIVNTVTNPLVGQTFAATRTWRAIDSCSNSSACSQTVTLVDTTPPVIFCSTNITVECAGPPGAVVAFVTTASDVCDTNVAIVCVPPSGSTFVLGLTTVRCVATDDSGNTNACTFTVRVRDTTPPTIVCPANIIAAEFPHEGGSAVVPFAAPVTGDICDNSLAVACVPTSGTAFPVGYTTVKCTARDDSGNSNSCTFLIRVIAYRLTVTSTADALAGSLRQALLDANDAPGENLVQFNLPGAAPHRIALLGALPVITSPLILNGASQPGFAGTPVVELDGSGAGRPDGLIVRAGSSTIRALAWQGFATALRLETNGGNIVQGNLIGLFAAGAVGPGNTGDGIAILSGSNLIGGSAVAERNVIANNRGSGVIFDTPGAVNNALRGNFIGLAPNGLTSVGNGVDGITISSGAARNSVGGTDAGAANRIAFSGRNGVTIASGGAQNSIRANLIFANALLGIDLAAAGPTPNDAGDADNGPNNLQNFPVLSDAVSVDGVTTIDGTLNSIPSRAYQLDFFLNDTADPSGYGEAEVYLGSTSVATLAGGSGNFSVSFAVTATFLQFVTATVTDAAGNSSEFSPWLQVRTPPVLEAQPVATNALPGAPATFCAEASGTGPIYYQWRHNGQNIPDATNACYTLSITEVADGGTYDVVIYNVLGARETDSAPLTVPLDTLTAGDNFADAVLITGTNGLVSWQNRAASVEAGEPRHAGKPGGKSVWYKWTPAKTGITTVRTRGSTFDTLLAVYEGKSVTNLEAVAFDEDRGGYFTSGVRFNAHKKHTYYIAVDGFGAASGDFVFAWSHEKTKKLLPILDTQPLSQAVGQGGIAYFTILSDCVCGEGHRRNDCPDWEPHECEEDDDGRLEHDHHHHPAHLPPGLSYQWFLNGVVIPGASWPSLTISNVQPANVGTYTVQVSTRYNRTTESQDAILQINDTATGVQPVLAMDKFLDAALSAQPLRLGNAGAGFAPSGGGFQPAAVVRGYTGTQVFNTTTASTEGGEEPICGVLGGKSEWITFLPDESGTLFLNTDGSTYDTVVAVFIRNPTNNQLIRPPVACDNNSGIDHLDSSMSFPVLAGQTNYIVVDGVKSASGTLRLNFSLVTTASLSSQGFTPQRAHKLRVTSRVGAKFAIQTSSNLVNWTTLFTTTNAPTNPFDYIDASSTQAPVRVYRTQLLP